MAIVKKLAKRGFTLIELMIVVVIIGILASLAIYGVQKYVSNSKSAEARMMLGRISKDAVSAFESESTASGLLAPGASAAIARELCDDAGAVPTAISSISAKKFQPDPQSFNVGGWRCLGTTVTTPIYFQYEYEAVVRNSPAQEDDEFLASARGDLDGDSVTSLFTMTGKVNRDTSGGLTLLVSPAVAESRPDE